MAKKRKTKFQKKLADNRHTFHHQASPLIYEVKPSMPQTQPKKNLITHSYLMKDLSKTALLSSAIIAFQVILFFILKNHLIKIPGISY
ncbi:MAG: hypothetical protein A3B38_02965 [Candidatus Levybacteria bacterium RIFCSPLOWO2_01_FULL_36_13]|nr:MAG: hypothetical protein A2684_04055 [Candidatus Levybacteria bacterium RIFCSPHIGHO2_01_FULL_36_15b]OGH35853.1 MAG: hypothetical protein A3B38_02965 [Candidatus Levybacteria bacterium RIFCSPLOWO2_01_FULL_36_13]